MYHRIVGLLGDTNAVFSNWTLGLMLLFNGLGACLSYLLLKKQLHVQSNMADRICILWKKSSCNNVLEMPAAKLLGIFGWSEVGMAYFVTNAVVLILFSSCFPYLGSLSVLSLIYVVWSIWYQGVRVRSWCPLCLLVQGLFILQSIVFVSYQLPRGIGQCSLGIDFVGIGVCYLMSLLLLNMLVSKLATVDEAVQWKYKYNSLKAREDVFQALQARQANYDISQASTLIFGKTDASKTITVFSNPYCNPCAMIHKRLNGLLEEDCRVQYVFTYFNEQLSNVNKYLIAAYQTLGPEKTWDILSAWYDGGKIEERISLNRCIFL